MKAEQPPWWLAGLLVGLALGLGIGYGVWLIGALLGAVFGNQLGKQLSRNATLAEQRFKALEARADALATEVERLRAVQGAVDRPAVTAEPVPPVAPQTLAAAATAIPVEIPAAVIAVPAPPVSAAPASLPPTSPPMSAPIPREPAAHPVMRWLLGGNTVVRVAVIVLFFGVAFLLKYAYDHTQIPIGVRLSGTGLGAVALLVLGWRLRTTRPDYALPVQGGAVGMLYITLFVAYKLYDLIGAPMAFAAMVGVVALSATLALQQNALSLAVLGILGGFLAPILASSNSGDHVLLFSYYLLLDIGILVISLYKAWRVLNLLGFVFTFVVASVWGGNSYQPAHFASTEPFLFAFFLLYVAVAVLFARRQADALLYHVDGTLVFGVPLVGFALQAALVRDTEYGAAWSALALAIFYLAGALALWRGKGSKLRLLAESFLALGVGFATLTIPLAFDGRVTSATWALEGAAVVWGGVRQGRSLPRRFGMLLQFAAGVAFVLGVHHAHGETPVFNSLFMSGAFVAAGGLFCACYLERNAGRVARWEAMTITITLLIWGVLWWAAAGLHEVGRHVAFELRPHAALAFMTLSAASFGALSLKFQWLSARWLGYGVLPLGVLWAVYDAGHIYHPAAHYGYLLWPVVLMLHLGVMRAFEPDHAERDSKAHHALHALGLLLLAALLSWELSWQVGELLAASPVWKLVGGMLIPALLLLAVRSNRALGVWPVVSHLRAYVLTGAVPLVGFLVLWSLWVNVRSNGDPAPLSYLPLLNPLDLAHALIAFVLLRWLSRLRELDLAESLGNAATLYKGFGALGFVWANGLLLRTLHHWGDVAFERRAMFNSVLVQAALSLFWTTLALSLMIFATRRRWRELWLAGAGLLGVVVAKLFLFDLSHVSGVERIVSFIGVGLLMLVVGYFAPLPPREEEAASGKTI